jgi:hypothetical protein
MNARHRAIGRHRSTPAPLSSMQRLTTAGGLVALAMVGSVVWPTIASADPPLQTAWFNVASGGGQAAPDPATPSGGLHESMASSQLVAFGAVQYALPTGASGQLTLQVAQAAAPPAVNNPTSPSTTPAFSFQACPITGAWHSGDDQPSAAAPTYSTKHCFSGGESSDGTSVSFFVDGTGQKTAGLLNLAIVPIPNKQVPTVGGDSPVDTTPPTSVDFDKPDASSLAISGGSSQPVAGGSSSGSSGGGSSSSGSSGSGSSASSPPGSSSAGTSSGSTGGSTLPPDLGSSTTTTTTGTDSGAAPVVAGQSTPTSTNTTPVAATTPTTKAGHNWALVLLILLGFALLASMIQRNNAALPIGERGLGRFRQQRQSAPRPLI